MTGASGSKLIKVFFKAERSNALHRSIEQSINELETVTVEARKSQISLKVDRMTEANSSIQAKQQATL
jgi:hypothetical protein